MTELDKTFQTRPCTTKLDVTVFASFVVLL